MFDEPVNILFPTVESPSAYTASYSSSARRYANQEERISDLAEGKRERVMQTKPARLELPVIGARARATNIRRLGSAPAYTQFPGTHIYVRVLLREVMRRRREIASDRAAGVEVFFFFFVGISREIKSAGVCYGFY